jgi:hypothetical protein
MFRIKEEKKIRNNIISGGYTTWDRYGIHEKSYEFYQKIIDLPPAAKFILYILDVKKVLNRKAIEKETLLPKRTVGTSLTILLQSKLIIKIEGKSLQSLPCLDRKRIDYRETYYQIAL